jgi:hypothetical protein
MSDNFPGVSDALLLVARYATEDAMQIDLAKNEFKWYCFATDQGTLVVITTRAEEEVSAPDGFEASSALETPEPIRFQHIRRPGTITDRPQPSARAISDPYGIQPGLDRRYPVSYAKRSALAHAPDPARSGSRHAGEPSGDYRSSER